MPERRQDGIWSRGIQPWDPAVGSGREDPAVGSSRGDPAVGIRPWDPAVESGRGDPAVGIRPWDPAVGSSGGIQPPRLATAPPHPRGPPHSCWRRAALREARMSSGRRVTSVTAVTVPAPTIRRARGPGSRRWDPARRASSWIRDPALLVASWRWGGRRAGARGTGGGGGRIPRWIAPAWGSADPGSGRRIRRGSRIRDPGSPFGRGSSLRGEER